VTDRTDETDLADQAIGELVAAHPDAARVLERHGVDYCCGGRRTLIEACAAAGADERVVEAELAVIGGTPAADWATLDPPALARHVVEHHHLYLHEELPLLDALSEKVLGAHGRRHPELAEVRRLVGALRADLEPHLRKEEVVLFPAIDALATGQREFGFGSIGNPIRMMGLEHDRAGELLSDLRAATDRYSVPMDACASYRSLYGRLAHLEADTHEHIHKENNVLFPAAMALADA
jgi:regulator of cell morphogenesis and NO signaling